VASDIHGHRVDTCGCGGVKYASSKRCNDCVRGASRAVPPAEQTVATDRNKQRQRVELDSLRRRYDDALKTIEQQERELQSLNILRDGLTTHIIEPKFGSGTSEATPVLVASDWHTEENVGAEIGGLNVYNVEIAKERADRFFRSGLRLVNLLGQDVKITNVVLALLGDFITNDIHDGEQVEMNELQPVHALLTAQNYIISGIEFLLKHSPYSFTIPCHSGNHARTTKKTRFSAENGHSLEYLMYLHLATYFKHEPRVTILVPAGMHSYMQVYDQMVRFHHGHAIKYGGGVGGIFIPTYKAIAQWNKGRHADLDVFGHFHQSKDGGNFLCNGSLIGYNAFALSIKADYEQPKQTLFLLDKKRGRTCTWPILVNG
jgi:hypothetical protein